MSQNYEVPVTLQQLIQVLQCSYKVEEAKCTMSS